MSREPDPNDALFRSRILENLDLCEIVARQMSAQLGVSLPREDAVAMARESLTVAARDFDDSLGVPFRRYANLRIRGGLIDGVRQRGPLPKRVYRALRAMEAADHVQDAWISDQGQTPTATPEEADAKLGEYLDQAAMAMALSFLSMRTMDEAAYEPDTADRPDEIVARRELFARLQSALATLTEQEQHVMKRVYFDGEKMLDAGKELGLSKSWTSRLHARALETLSRRLAELLR